MKRLRARFRTVAMVVRNYTQLPPEVHGRDAVSFAARCLDGDDLATQIKQRSDDHCAEAEYWAVMELLYTRPLRGEEPPPTYHEGGIPYCGCNLPLYHYAPLLSQSDLSEFRPPADGKRYSEADLGAVEEPLGCVGCWLDMSSELHSGRPPAVRSGRSGRPGSPVHLRGRLRGLVALIERARAPVQYVGVVSPATCAALLLFFSGEDLEPPLPAIEMTRAGVASRRSLRRLAKRIDDLVRLR